MTQIIVSIPLERRFIFEIHKYNNKASEIKKKKLKNKINDSLVL